VATAWCSQRGRQLLNVALYLQLVFRESGLVWSDSHVMVHNGGQSLALCVPLGIRQRQPVLRNKCLVFVAPSNPRTRLRRPRSVVAILSRSQVQDESNLVRTTGMRYPPFTTSRPRGLGGCSHSSSCQNNDLAYECFFTVSRVDVNTTRESAVRDDKAGLSLFRY
jgi:hypothetical protein